MRVGLFPVKGNSITPSILASQRSTQGVSLGKRSAVRGLVAKQAGMLSEGQT